MSSFCVLRPMAGAFAIRESSMNHLGEDGDHGLVSELLRIAADDRLMLFDEPVGADDGALVLDRAFR